jgi:hypothetical protein
MSIQRNTYASTEGEELYVSYWRVDDYTHRLQTNDPDVVRRVKTWDFAQETGWGWDTYLYVFVIPNSQSRWVAKQFGFNGHNRSAKQDAVTRNLVKRGHGHRFDVKHSGQGDLYTAHRGTISPEGIPMPHKTTFGSYTAVQIQEGASL